MARPDCAIGLQLIETLLIFSRPKLNKIISVSLKTAT